MPNQYNFRNEVVNRTESRFLASRIVTLPTDQILLEEIPASFGYDSEDNVEIHFYEANTNVLITSIVTKLSDGVVKLHIVAYDDGTYKTYLQIDFTKLFVDSFSSTPPIDYRVTINFFSDEIGSYNDRTLAIGEISPSRTEVELFFINRDDPVVVAKNNTLIREFVIPSFTKADAIGVVQKILTGGVTTNDDTEGVTGANVLQNINQSIQTINPLTDPIRRMQNVGLEEQFATAIDNYLPKLFENIREKIVIGDERVQADELERFIAEEVSKTIQQLQVSLDTRIQIE